MRILIVEDEKEIADGTARILEKEGYLADTVYDGLSGLFQIRSGIYDLVLLDIMLPEMSGLDIMKKVRAEKNHVPVIMITARSLVEDKIMGLDMGADDYLTKPYDAGELLARIRARIRGSGFRDPENLTAYDISLTPSTYHLSRQEKSVKLSKTEYQLLEYLMINKGQILTKDMLVIRVWGYEDTSDYNNLEVYISFLRKKLAFVKANAVIRTKKGIGYSLEEAK